MKTIIVTSTSPYRKAMFDLTWPNHVEYCKRHGYDMYDIRLEDGDWAYKKHEVFKELFAEGYDLVAHKDDDSLFTNLSVPYESFIDYTHDFYITEDCGGLNGGSVIIKNSFGGRWMNHLVLEARDGFANEQDFYNNNPFPGLVKVLPHPSINSYKYDEYKEFPDRVGREDLGDWKEGHFILHLPALTIERRIEIIKQTKVIG